MNLPDRLTDRYELAASLRAARAALLEVYSQLPEVMWDCASVPYRETINPPLWELGHIAWFQEHWCERWPLAGDRKGLPPSRLPNADALLDSRIIPHRDRWTVPYPARPAITAYMDESLTRVVERLADWDEQRIYFARLSLHHEQMHAEALKMTLNALGLPLPVDSSRPAITPGSGDWQIDGGCYPVGGVADQPEFLFDNEKYRHEVKLSAYAISKQVVTAGAFSEFVASGGYRSDKFWSSAGNAWRAGRSMPEQWEVAGDGFSELQFGRRQRIDHSLAMQCVNLYEAEAYCRWAGRRLPTEFEWEVAAARSGAFRDSIGQVWEWTASAFLPFPGFSPDPYREYSQPWFGDHQVLRGGSWATHAHLKRPGFRNFYLPHRNDVFAGFRTCAV